MVGGENMWILPPLVGQRVILNPEYENYNRYNQRQAKDNAGTVIFSDERVEKRWGELSLSTRNSISISVKWDNGNTYDYRLSALLPIDAPIEIMTTISFEDGSEFVLRESELEEVKDRKIIKEGRLVHRETNNKGEREEVLKRLSSFYKDYISSGRELSAHHLETWEELIRLGFTGEEQQSSTEQEVIERLARHMTQPRRPRQIEEDDVEQDGLPWE